MPELPEVETICRSLAHKLEQRRIVQLDVRLPRLIKWPSAGDFPGIFCVARLQVLSGEANICCFI